MAGSVILTPESANISGAVGLSYGQFSGAGGNAAAVENGWNVQALLAQDASISLRFMLPATVPTGNMTLRVRSMSSSANAGEIGHFVVSDAAVAAGASPSAASLTAESQATITLPATPAGKYVFTDVLLSATPAANGVIVATVKFQTASWSISQLLLNNFFLVWA